MATKEKILEIQDRAFVILKAHFAQPLIDACRDAFWQFSSVSQAQGDESNRAPIAIFSPALEPPCFAQTFFFHLRC